LSNSVAVAAAEVITFADAHGEHATWALTIRDDATCRCTRGNERTLVSPGGDDAEI